MELTIVVWLFSICGISLLVSDLLPHRHPSWHRWSFIYLCLVGFLLTGGILMGALFF